MPLGAARPPAPESSGIVTDVLDCDPALNIEMVFACSTPCAMRRTHLPKLTGVGGSDILFVSDYIAKEH